jgi:hypothetical protein
MNKISVAICKTSLSFVCALALLAPGGDATWSDSLTSSKSFDTIQLKLETPAFQIATAADSFAEIEIDGFSLSAIPGSLALPRRVVSLALPPDADLDSLSLQVLTAEVEELPGVYQIRNIQPDISEEGTVSPIDPQPLSIIAPDSYVRLLSTGQMRKWRFVSLEYSPFTYDALLGKLSLASRVVVSISYKTSQDGEDTALLADSLMDDLAKGMFLNYADAQAWYPTPDSPDQPSVVYDYVIITTNAIESGSVKLDDFVTHKQNRGYSVLTITENEYGSLTGQSPNGTAEKIRKWLQNNYVADSIKYVLLIGNPDPDDPSIDDDSVGDIPMKMCWPRGKPPGDDLESPTDYFYADLTGNWDKDGDGYYGEWSQDTGTGGVDFAPEVFVGRIPVYSAAYATLDNVLQKIIDYEDETDPYSWRRNALLPMSFSLDYYDGAPLAEQMIDDYLDGASFSSWTQYQQNSGPVCNPDSIYASSEELRGGTVVRNRWTADDYGLVVWWGHGSETGAYVGYDGCWDGTLFESSQTVSLDDDHPAFIYQNSCTNGYPENSNNLQYSLLKQGAVAAVSASRVSWFNDGVGYGDFDGSTTNSGIAYEYAKRLVAGQTASQALYNAKSGMNPLTSNTRLMNYYDFNLYGDPAAYLLPLLAPTGLDATAVSQTQINLTWSDTNVTETGYKIERSPNGTTGWSQIATVGADSTSFPDTGLSCGTSYHYRVQAYHPNAVSPYSSPADATTSPCTPGAFNKVSPADGATGQSDSPTLSWQSSSPATRYDYCYDTSDDDNCSNWIDNGVITNVNLSGLSHSTTYYWHARSWNGSLGPVYSDGGSSAFWSFTVADDSPIHLVFMPLVVKGNGEASPMNGDFEQGPGVGWQEFSTHGWDIIMDSASLPFPPHSGSWATWFGGGNDETSRLYQQITVPTSAPTLTFWYWIWSEDYSGYDYGYVLIDDVPILQFDLCADQQTGTWVRQDLDLSAYAGQVVDLEFQVVTDGSLNSNLFVDDVSFDGAFTSSGLSSPSPGFSIVPVPDACKEND